jgi:hypothetical protein
VVIPFLNSNPSEAIIMSVKEEYNPDNNTRTFEQTFDAYVAQNSSKWNLSSSIPTLSQARGKITLFRRFSAGTAKGIDASSWPDNTTFTSGSLRVQDNYTVSDNNTKWSQITSLLTEAKSGSSGTLYVNFTSGVKSFLGVPDITGVSNTINPNVSSYFTDIWGRYGIIVMDFADTTRTAKVYNANNTNWLHLEAEAWNSNSGTGTETCSEGGQNLMDVGDGEWVSFNNINFENVSGFQARVASGNYAGTIEFRAGSSSGTLLGTCSAPNTGGWQNWTTVSCAATGSATGTGTLYLVFHGTGSTGQNPNVNWVRLFGNTLQIEAESYSSNSGLTTESCSEGGQDVADVGDGEWAAYSNVRFSGITSFQARVASANYAGTIEFRKGSTTGQLMATCSAPYTGGWQTWTTVSCSVTSAATGGGTLYAVFHGTGVGSQNPNMNWFKLIYGGAQIEAESYSSNSGISTESCSEGGQNIKDVGNNEWTAYSSVTFDNVSQYSARVASGNLSGTIEFRKGGTGGTLLATCSAPNTGGWQTWTTVTCPGVAMASGSDTLYLVFKGTGSGSQQPNVNWVKLQ